MAHNDFYMYLDYSSQEINSKHFGDYLATSISAIQQKQLYRATFLDTINIVGSSRQCPVLRCVLISGVISEDVTML